LAWPLPKQHLYSDLIGKIRNINLQFPRQPTSIRLYWLSKELGPRKIRVNAINPPKRKLARPQASAAAALRGYLASSSRADLSEVCSVIRAAVEKSWR
jgi:hypothetical protein